MEATIKGKRSKRERPMSPISLSWSSEEDMAHCLILLARGPTWENPDFISSYQCKTCDRCFPSFQALGGHRASHKINPKGASTSTSKVHECTICGVEFPSGQALGGHMRRHPDPAKKHRMAQLELDLNLPAAPQHVIFFSASPLLPCPQY